MQLTLGVYIGLAVLGLVVGIVSGMLGLGGGVLVVPMLVMIFGFDQKMANGTSLAMIFPPAAIPALRVYFRSGNMHIGAAATLALGFLIGAYIGALLANADWMHPDALRTFFGFFALFLATLMLFRGDLRVRSVVGTLGVMGSYFIVFYAMRLLGRRWDRQFHLDETYRRRAQMPMAPDYQI